MSELDPLVAKESHRDGTFLIFVRPCLAEFVGTTLFVFIGCMVVQTGDIVSIGLAHGLMIALLIMAFGNISGGHFNPAVTLGVTLSKGVQPTVAVGYFISQLLGGMLGAAFVRAALPHDTYELISGGATMLGEETEAGWAIFVEGLLTFILVFTVLLTAVDDVNKTSLAPLAIGFVVSVDIMAGGNVTGASMNPARSLGPAVVYSPFISNGQPEVWTYHYVYWLGPLAGVFAAAFIYRTFFASSSQRLGRFY